MSKSCKYKDCKRGTYSEYCFAHKPKKPIKQLGKRTIEYNHWRDTVAKPFLDEYYGHVCSVPTCQVANYLEVDHKLTRGSRPDLKKELSNVQYLCFIHHDQKTNRSHK